MSRRFQDSFDHYTTLTQKWDSAQNNASIQTAAARTGIQGMRVTNIGRVTKNVTTNSECYVGFAFEIQTAPTGETDIFCVIDGTTEQVAVGIDPTGHIVAYRNSTGGAGTGTLLGTSTLAVSFNVFHYVECHVKVNSSTGVVEVKVDGVSYLSLTGQNTQQTGNASFGAISLGNNSNSGGIFYYDDFYYNDTAGSVNNGFNGNTVIQCKVPTGNGSTNSWSIGGGSPAATNWQSVNEIPPDDGTTLVSSSTVGAIDLYTYAAVSGASVDAVAVNLRAGTDVGGTRAIRAEVKSSSTSADNGSDFPLTTSFQDFQGIFETDPNTSAAWSVAGVNAAQFGEKVTV